jgi:arylsulfatase A-like enzyme
MLMATESERGTGKPNVILLMTDQQRADALGCMGNRLVQTPNLDRLMTSGVIFEQAYVQCPVCMASRGAIHTGRYPRSLRMKSMDILSPEETTLAETLQRAGYVTGLFGKLHFTPEGYTRDQLKSGYAIDDVRPFLEPAGVLNAATRAASEDPVKQNYSFQTSVGITDNNWDRYLDWLRERAPDCVKHFVAENWGRPREGVSYGSSPPATRVFHPLVTDFFDSHVPAELHPSAFIVEKALEFVKANRGRPFFAHVSFVDPHHPFNAPPPYSGMYRPEEMPRPAEFDRGKCFPPGLPEGVRKVIERRATYPPELFQWALANYYGMISNIDACVGRLLDGLDELELTDDTLIVFISDHGEYVGDHGLLYKGSLLFDGLMRVPLSVSWGDQLKSPTCQSHFGDGTPGRRVTAMVQEIDVYPTVMSLLGLPIHAGVQGKDLSGTLRVALDAVPESSPRPGVVSRGGRQQAERGGASLGETQAGYEQITCELDDLPDRQYAGVYALRTKEWKLIYFPVARTGMLFHLREDPGELHNLYFDSGYASVRAELFERLLDYLYTSKDPLPIRLSQA